MNRGLLAREYLRGYSVGVVAMPERFFHYLAALLLFPVQVACMGYSNPETSPDTGSRADELSIGVVAAQGEQTGGDEDSAVPRPGTHWAAGVEATFAHRVLLKKYGSMWLGIPTIYIPVTGITSLSPDVSKSFSTLLITPSVTLMDNNEFFVSLGGGLARYVESPMTIVGGTAADRTTTTTGIFRSTFGFSFAPGRRPGFRLSGAITLYAGPWPAMLQTGSAAHPHGEKLSAWRGAWTFGATQRF